MLPMVAPVPRSWQEWQQRRAFDEQILPQCWTCMDDTANEEGENDGYAICMGEELMINQLAGGTSSFTVDTTPLSTTSSTSSYRPSTYGEISPKGVRQLFHAMKLTSPNAHDTNSSPSSSSTVFVDLGSGTGKVVVQAALEIPHLSQAIGWELAPSRHAAAMRALTRARESILDSHYYLIDTNLLSSSRIQLHQGDLFEAAANDNHLYQATHIWIASLCFSPSMMERLEYMLAERWFGGGTTSDRKNNKSQSKRNRHDQESPASSLQCVASLQRFPGTLLGIPQVINMEMPWCQPRGCPVYLYWGPSKSGSIKI